VTERHGHEEGAEEAIEDLEAPAMAQGDVVGGAHCIRPSCVGQSVVVACSDVSPSCKATTADCQDGTHVVVIHVQ
jgi:hypothetical protein